MSEVTRLIDAAAVGDEHAAAELLPLVYAELRKLAEARLANEKPGQTLQPTALVHEAYLRLVGSDPAQPWNGRGHLFAAAEAMRRVLIANAHRKNRLKRGAGNHRMELTEAPADLGQDPDDILAIDEAIGALEREDPAKAELVRLRYFAGLTLEQAADCQGISLATAKRRWAVARAWLYRALSGDSSPPAPHS